jgi:hypothetical protein
MQQRQDSRFYATLKQAEKRYLKKQTFKLIRYRGFFLLDKPDCWQ